MLNMVSKAFLNPSYLDENNISLRELITIYLYLLIADPHESNTLTCTLRDKIKAQSIRDIRIKDALGPITLNKFINNLEYKTPEDVLSKINFLVDFYLFKQKCINTIFAYHSSEVNRKILQNSKDFYGANFLKFYMNNIIQLDDTSESIDLNVFLVLYAWSSLKTREILRSYIEIQHIQSYPIKELIQPKSLSKFIDKYIKNNQFKLKKLLKKLNTLALEHPMQRLSNTLESSLNFTSKTKTINIAENSEFITHFKRFGKIKYIHGLVALSAIKNNKKNIIKPILLNDYDKNNKEFLKFLGTIKNNLHLLTDQQITFISSGIHWIPGYISISKTGQIGILISDSLSVTERENNEICVNGFLKEVLKVIHSVFGNNICIYVADTKRQNTYKGCSVFSIDDAMHFENVGSNLPKDYQYKGGVFDYLQAHAKEYFLNLDTKENATQEKHSDSSFQFNITRLPLYLMRTWQSSKLISDHFLKNYPKEELTTLFTKKKITPIDSATAHFQANQNMRLVHKLKRIRKKTREYLNQRSLQLILNDAHQYTLAAFEKKISAAANKKSIEPKTDIQEIECGMALLNIYERHRARVKCQKICTKTGEGRLQIQFVESICTDNDDADDKLRMCYGV